MSFIASSSNGVYIRPTGFKLGVHIGDFPCLVVIHRAWLGIEMMFTLHELECSDRLAELLSRVHIFHGIVKGSLHYPQRPTAQH